MEESIDEKQTPSEQIVNSSGNQIDSSIGFKTMDERIEELKRALLVVENNFIVTKNELNENCLRWIVACSFMLLVLLCCLFFYVACSFMLLVLLCCLFFYVACSFMLLVLLCCLFALCCHIVRFK